MTLRVTLGPSAPGGEPAFTRPRAMKVSGGGIRIARTTRLLPVTLPCAPIVRPAMRPDKADRLHPLFPRETPRWRKLYQGRAAVEREFGRLKNDWALLPLRVRGLDRVALHADLTILAKLACALARARARAVALKRLHLLPRWTVGSILQENQRSPSRCRAKSAAVWATSRGLKRAVSLATRRRSAAPAAVEVSSRMTCLSLSCESY